MYALPWVAEGYGFQHSYQLQAIVRTMGSSGINYFYDWTSFGGARRMTCVEPITADPDHIVSPSSGEAILVSDLRNGQMTLAWKSVGGATDYLVTVERVEPGIGPQWHSRIIYHYCGPWPDDAILSISDNDRLALASLLSGAAFFEKEIRWRVDARNSTDSLPLCWTEGDRRIQHQSYPARSSDVVSISRSI